MKKIANIVYREELVNHKPLQYINYYIEDIQFRLIDNDLPTLYVGWYFFKEIHKNDPIIENASILEKKIITNKLYWEFSFKENKSQHVNGIDDFVVDSISYYFSPRYNYINLDPLHFLIKDLDDLFDVLPTEIDSIYNYKGEMIYILKDNKITGIDLNLYRYFDFDILALNTKLTSRLKNNLNYHNDPRGEFLLAKSKIYKYFENLKRYMVVILN
jgi:hypothetical protein